MPIAFCYTNREYKVSQSSCEQLLEDWSQLAKVSKEYCTINLIENTIQVGNAYKLMVKLYLPSLWMDDEIKNIQHSLYQSICRNLEIKPEDIFIMTSIIQSGHVVDRGRLEEW